LFHDRFNRFLGVASGSEGVTGSAERTLQSGFLRIKQHLPELKESDRECLADLMARIRLSDMLEALGPPRQKVPVASNRYG
jgi:hypothetical protein